MDAEGRTFINKEMIPYAEFGRRISQAMTNRSAKVVFFAADGSLTYDKVANFMDLCRDNGVQNLGIVFDDLRPSAGLASTLATPPAPAPATP
jgi:biopolymer transport protein ExbD